MFSTSSGSISWYARDNWVQTRQQDATYLPYGRQHWGVSEETKQGHGNHAAHLCPALMTCGSGRPPAEVCAEEVSLVDGSAGEASSEPRFRRLLLCQCNRARQLLRANRALS